jgi:CRISPR-associated protein Cas2
MYVVVVYDIGEERVTNVMKVCRVYFHHIQNSVFEGYINQKNYKEFKGKVKEIIKRDEDSLLIFKFRKREVFTKEVVGLEKNPAENIL